MLPFTSVFPSQLSRPPQVSAQYPRLQGGIQHLGEGHDGGDKHQPMDACNFVHLL